MALLNLPALANQALRRAQILGAPRWRARIVGVLPHDGRAFTQGLCFVGEQLYESTGTWQASSLRRLDPTTGALLEKVSVPDDFAEDIAFHDGHIFQLTWQSGRLLKYALDPITFITEYRYPHEGWGLATIGGDFLVSDGSARLRRYDPEMSLLETRQVRCAGFPFRHLNAMAVAGQVAYANVWPSKLIACIDTMTMRITGTIDCTELHRIENPANVHHILNGIAFHPGRRTLLVTGKYWRNMFEIMLPGQ